MGCFTDGNMEVLREHTDFITGCVPTKEILDFLTEKELLARIDYGKIIIVGETCKNGFEANKDMFDALLTILETYRDDRESTYGIFAFIRREYPAVSVCIPAIQNDQRMKTAIGPDTMFTVGLFGKQMGYDLRKVKVGLMFSSY